MGGTFSPRARLKLPLGSSVRSGGCVSETPVRQLPLAARCQSGMAALGALRRPSVRLVEVCSKRLNRPSSAALYRRQEGARSRKWLRIFGYRIKSTGIAIDRVLPTPKRRRDPERSSQRPIYRAKQWSGAPAETRSFVLIVEDPDAPSGVFRHWAVYDLPPEYTALPEAIGKGPVPVRLDQGVNDFGPARYDGP